MNIYQINHTYFDYNCINTMIVYSPFFLAINEDNLCSSGLLHPTHCHNPNTCKFHVEARLSKKMLKCHHSLSLWNWFQVQCKLLSYLQKFNTELLEDVAILEHHKLGSSECFYLRFGYSESARVAYKLL